MPGLVPGMHVFGPFVIASNDVELLPRSNTGTRNIFFIIFVDGMFTSFIACPFTNTSHASAPMRAISCVVHAGHAD
jgi:hypothetical protein